MTAETSTSGAGNEDPVGKQVLHQAQEIARLKRNIEELATETTDTIAGVMARVDSVEEALVDAGPPKSGSATSWCWRELGPQASSALWEELIGWVGWIRARYPLARRVPSCWAQHPEIVEEVTALWLAWQAAYTERDAALTAAADWHDRWLPGFLYRLEHGPFAIDCSATHHERPASAYAEPEAADAATPRPIHEEATMHEHEED